MIVCASCGARIAADAEQCNFCGWPVGQADHDMSGKIQESSDVVIGAPENNDASTDEGPFCHMCGWKNPVGARFCSACGTKLQEVDKTTKKATLPSGSIVEGADEQVAEEAVAGSEEAKPMNTMHVGMLVVAGVLVVASLYMITSFSRRAFPEAEPAAAQAQATESAEATAGSTELSADVAERIAALEAEAADLSGEALILKKREMVSVLAGVNRPDKAAAVQEEIAGLSQDQADWFQAGHFYYDAMEAMGGEPRFAAAQSAATAYEKGLEIGPDDLNIRTAMAMSYLNTRAPMQGVQQIRQVLETDPDHLQGNFYYGVMLSQINRLDQARAQFERVKELVGPESPVYQQADMMLQNLDNF